MLDGGSTFSDYTDYLEVVEVPAEFAECHLAFIDDGEENFCMFVSPSLGCMGWLDAHSEFRFGHLDSLVAGRW